MATVSTILRSTADPAASARPGGPRRGGIALRSPAEIESMHRAGAVLRDALAVARTACVPGVTTAEVDELARRAIRDGGGTPLFLGYPDGDPDRGFPAATCISVNDEIVHGIPGPRVVRDGDLVSIDCGVRLDGWCADAAITVTVGAIDRERAALVSATEAILARAISMIAPGRRWSEIAAVLHGEAVRTGHGLIHGYVGHGIGRELHEAPEVPCYDCGDARFGRDFTIRPGMTFAVEPMLALRPSRGSEFADVRHGADGWTVLTADGSPAAHVEHTIAVTRTRTLVLTA